MPKIVIASRKSDLARIQAQSVALALGKMYPTLDIELCYRESLGDKNQNDPLWKMPEKGVFTQDFRADLLSGRIDIVVHSWKDLPTDMGKETRVVGALPRADQRDLLLIKKTVLAKGKKSALRLLSSSPRRSHNLAKILPSLLPSSLNLSKIEFGDLRGNVPTRIKKCLADETSDGLVLAKAGIDRLLSANDEEFQEMRRTLREFLTDFRWAVLPLSLNPTAAAQGALALEIKVGRADLESILEPLLCCRTTVQVQIERKILKSYGGGCHQKIGVSVIDHPLGELVSLRGETDGGEVLNAYELLGDYLRRARADIIPLLSSELSNQRLDASSLRWSSEDSFDSRQVKIVFDKKYFPKSKSETLKVFDRRPLEVNLERLRHQPLMVARANALPENYVPGAEQLLWTAGTETWKALAARSYWVSGCSDSLGEDFEPQGARIDALAPQQFGGLVKVTHDNGEVSGNTVATYSLVVRSDAMLASPPPQWFYWMSGSAFLWALNKNPEICHSLHSCGPGNTLKTILKHVSQANVRVYPNFDIWLEQIERAKGNPSL